MVDKGNQVSAQGGGWVDRYMPRATLGVVCFLALQVWLLNERMGRMEERQNAAATIQALTTEAMTDRLNQALQGQTDRLNQSLQNQREWNTRVELLLQNLTNKVDKIANENK